MLKYADISGCKKSQFTLFSSEHAEPCVARQLLLEESQRAFYQSAISLTTGQKSLHCRQKCLKLPVFSLRTRNFIWDALPVERINDITLVLVLWTTQVLALKNCFVPCGVKKVKLGVFASKFCL